MTDSQPLACSLSAGDLQPRLDEIAAVGGENLIGRALEDGRHVLRFQSDPATRDRLERIVAAESDCCSFLDLTLAERDGELVLTIAAPTDGQFVADDLALAFAGGQA